MATYGLQTHFISPVDLRALVAFQQHSFFRQQGEVMAVALQHETVAEAAAVLIALARLEH